MWDRSRVCGPPPQEAIKPHADFMATHTCATYNADAKMLARDLALSWFHLLD
ncbi:MAG TPA: hypothetical protein VE093_28310 [Polyangiaceae bacterium]|jgi:hypothetical protein|nr:hypothetical protein [Polyangiaceae bacterium]